MTDTPDRDPCEELGRIGPPPPAEELRRKVYRRTRRLLPRPWRKRAALVAALAACYAAGFGTARLAPEPAPSPRPAVVAEQSPTPGDETAPPAPPASPRALEWQALDSPEQRPEAYRQAGDRYVAEAGDYQSALRCYREALDAGSDKDLAIAPQDSWLLMALKEARQKEKQYAHSSE